MYAIVDIWFRILKEPLGTAIVVASASNFNDILCKGTHKDAEEMTAVVEIFYSWICFDLFIVHNRRHPHDEWRPDSPVSVHEVEQAMGCLSKARDDYWQAAQEPPRVLCQSMYQAHIR